MSKELTPKQQRFVEEYLVDMNASAAYKRAGYRAKGNSAEVSALQLLRNPKVQAVLAAQREALSKRTEIKQDEIIRELARVGFSCITNYEAHGEELILKEDAPPDAMQAVSSFEIIETTYENSKSEVATTTRKVKIRLWPKVEALYRLGQHFGLFTEKLALTDPTGKKEYAGGPLTEEQRIARILAVLEHSGTARNRTAPQS